MSPQGRQSSFAVGRGTSGSSCIAAGLEQESQASSCVEEWNAVCLMS